jgi:hypothetical protein
VQEKLENLEDVNDELVNLSTEPCTRALSYRSMWAFGNHYRVQKGNMLHHGTYDSGVATMFSQARRGSSNPEAFVSELKYVGVLRDILLVTYCTNRRVVFCAAWAAANARGAGSVRQDAYGFWLVNFDRLDDHCPEPYTFPGQVSQVINLPFCFSLFYIQQVVCALCRTRRSMNTLRCDCFLSVKNVESICTERRFRTAIFNMHHVLRCILS